jgi:hypothetical protein
MLESNISSAMRLHSLLHVARRRHDGAQDRAPQKIAWRWLKTSTYPQIVRRID